MGRLFEGGDGAASLCTATSPRFRGNKMNSKPLLDQFRISASMQHYVLRIRLRGGDFDFGADPEAAVAFTKRIEEMRRILMKKRVSVILADRAISKTMEVAVDFQLAGIRYRFLKAMEDQSHAVLDRLIESLRQLRDAIARLSPSSKGELNRRIRQVLREPIFDTEVFIDLTEAVAAVLPNLSPGRQAKNALAIIDPEPKGDRRPPIIDMWETMPATTRVIGRRIDEASHLGVASAVAGPARRYASSRTACTKAGRLTRDHPGLRLPHRGDLANIGAEPRGRL
jgi:hypothetical protein